MCGARITVNKRRFNMDEHRLFVDKARKLANYCVEHGFEGTEVLRGMKVSQLAGMYDGIGPNWSWHVLASIIDHVSYEFEPAAFLLDVQYKAEFDRSIDMFHLCNHQFYQNCVKCVKMNYGWWNPKRYSLVRSAKVLYDACEEHGIESWNSKGEAKRE